MKVRVAIISIIVVTICTFKVAYELRKVRMKRNLVETAKKTESVVVVMFGRERRYMLFEKTRMQLEQAMSTAEFIAQERKRVCLGKMFFRDKLDNELLRLTLFDDAVYGYGEHQIHFNGGAMLLSDFQLSLLHGK